MKVKDNKQGKLKSDVSCPEDIKQRHPKGNRASVLLSSVFGPYAQNDKFGSRAINPMELYHNQVTRAQGAFSPRRFHQSWGIMMIQENITAPCTVLDFPTHKYFTREIEKNSYDIIGISGIIVNFEKVKEMCRLVREKSPHSTIIVGGHVAAIPDIENKLDADHIVKGDGISWMRAFLGEDVNAPIEHPVFSSGFYRRVMGITIPENIDNTATIVASLGCQMGCNFCTTSSFFGGKGKVFNVLSTGEELFRVMEKAEIKRNVKSFSIMDENFLLQKGRAMELLSLMKKNQKSWSLHVFSSANAIEMYNIEDFVEMGISSIWLGLESPKAKYTKLNGTNTQQLSKKLQQHGIVLLGSTIIGLEHQTPGNIREEIEHAVAHNTDFHQFMLYTPIPGTPLYKDMEQQEKLIDVNLADIHGQCSFNFKHDSISRQDSKILLDYAFQRDFEINGPSLFRMCRTTYQGWKRYRKHPDHRIRERFKRKTSLLRYIYASMLWAMEHKLKKHNTPVTIQIREMRQKLEQEFGPVTAVSARLMGTFLWLASNLEEKRLAKGRTFEPKTILTRKSLNSPKIN